MKFTDKTRSISTLHLPSKFRHALITACKVGIASKRVSDVADTILRNKGGTVVTDKMWEEAYERVRRSKRDNHLIRKARKEVQHVFELVSAVIGSPLSNVKHALETRHAVGVMRPIKLSLEEMTEDGIHRLKSQGAHLVDGVNGWHKMKFISVPFNDLEAILYEQARAFYTEPKKGSTG